MIKKPQLHKWTSYILSLVHDCATHTPVSDQKRIQFPEAENRGIKYPPLVTHGPTEGAWTYQLPNKVFTIKSIEYYFAKSLFTPH